MDTILKQIETFLSTDPQPKKEPSYLQMKNGRLPLKVGFSTIPEDKGSLPTLLIQPYSSEEVVDVLSRNINTKYSFTDIAEKQKRDPYSDICDYIVESSIKEVSLDLLENKDNELQKIENQLTDIVESGRVDVHTFSQNCLTNLSSYDINGNILQITDILVDKQSKKYRQNENEEIMVTDKLPHPIRTKKKIKKKEELIKKSERQVMEEFEILSNMFDEESLKTNKQQNYQQLINAVSLTDGNSYQDLWQKIIGEIKVSKQKAIPKNTNKNITKEMGDEQFQKAIDRIMQQAIEYEKEAFDAESEQQKSEEPDEEMVQKVEEEKKQEKPENNFESAKIQKNVKITSNSKYQFAVQDESQLSDFYDKLPKQKFATTYEFELDDFQKRSILHLQKKQSVFVAAHTSAGKTVIAQYGIALAINHKRKVIYTSPIKALSNQKYRQLGKKFPGSVGIVTGDVSLNQQANCVIMTTQILRNSLYKGAQMIRDIEWVIFDEVHYINNQQRGVVWEETIIMLPEHIGIIMLSATVPNYMDFANWVGRTKRRTIFVMKTLHRPVPLQHSLFLFNKFHVIKESNGRFLKEEYNGLRHEIDMISVNADVKNKALKEEKKKKIEERGFYNDSRREQRIKLLNKNAVDKFIKKITKADLQTTQGREEHRILQELIADCKKKKLLPCVIFTFSKKKINALASKVYINDLTSRGEKSKIARMFSHAFSNLKPQDRDIEQFNFLQQICFNGYAVHHGDLLPLAKEIVELLFSQGLIKVLFATETFAMGINMPTKTVIFNSIKKVTGSQGMQRFLNSSQYVQMSGRAGRRGLDEKGTVIIIVKDPGNLPESSDMQKMIDHPGERLQSKFRVTYTIILNLLNSKDFGVTEMLRQSFLENPKFSEFSSNMKSLKQYKGEYERIVDEFECPYNKLGTRILIDEYMNLSKNLGRQNQEYFTNYKKALGQPKYGKIIGYNNEIGICLILKVDYEKRQSENSKYIKVMIVNQIFLGMQLTKEEREEEEKKMGLKKKIVLEYDEDRKKNERFSTGQVLGTNNKFHYYVYWVSPSMIVQVYSNKLKSKYSFDDSKQLLRQLSQQLLSLPKQLIPVQGLGDSSNKEVVLKQLQTFDCHNCQLKDFHQNQHRRRQQLKGKLSKCAKKIDTNQLGMMGSFEGMLNLLVKFKFISQTIEGDGTQFNALTLKGRVAKEVDIYVAQVIVQAVLDQLDSAQIAALLSAFVCDFKPRPGRGEEDKPITPFNEKHTYTNTLSKAIDETYFIIKKIVEEEESSEAYLNLTSDSMDEHILSIINFHLSDTVYKWAIGFDFSDAASDTKAPQGTIVRAILRLNQLLSNVRSVCRIIGNHELQKKVVVASEYIKRDIVFCQSLYLTG